MSRVSIQKFVAHYRFMLNKFESHIATRFVRHKEDLGDKTLGEWAQEFERFINKQDPKKEQDQ